MQIKSIITGATIALAVTIGSAFAGETFAMLDGIVAEPLATAEMDAVVGRTSMPQVIHVTTDGSGVDFVAGRGEPGQLGAPPGVYLDGVNVSGG